MEFGYGLLILLIGAIVMCGVIVGLCCLEKFVFDMNEVDEEEDDDSIYCWEI